MEQFILKISLSVLFICALHVWQCNGFDNKDNEQNLIGPYKQCSKETSGTTYSNFTSVFKWHYNTNLREITITIRFAEKDDSVAEDEDKDSSDMLDQEIINLSQIENILTHKRILTYNLQDRNNVDYVYGKLILRRGKSGEEREEPFGPFWVNQNKIDDGWKRKEYIPGYKTAVERETGSKDVTIKYFIPTLDHARAKEPWSTWFKTFGNEDVLEYSIQVAVHYKGDSTECDQSEGEEPEVFYISLQNIQPEIKIKAFEGATTLQDAKLFLGQPIDEGSLKLRLKPSPQDLASLNLLLRAGTHKVVVFLYESAPRTTNKNNVIRPLLGKFTQEEPLDNPNDDNSYDLSFPLKSDPFFEIKQIVFLAKSAGQDGFYTLWNKEDGLKIAFTVCEKKNPVFCYEYLHLTASIRFENEDVK